MSTIAGGGIYSEFPGTVHKKYVGHRIGPTTPPSRLCVVIFPILKQIDVDLAESFDVQSVF